MLKFKIENATAKQPAEPARDIPISTQGNRLPGPLRFLVGVAGPAFLVCGAIWFGFIQQRINLPTTAGNIARSNYFTGDAAMWAGAGVISGAVCLFLLLYVCRPPYRLNTPFMIGVAALLAGIVCILVASAIN